MGVFCPAQTSFIGRERMQDGTFMDIHEIKILYEDKHNRTFKITGGKVTINPIYHYLQVGDLDSLLTDLKDEDLYNIVSYHERNRGGCSLRSVSDDGLIKQGWVLLFEGNEYNLFFNEFTPKK